MNTICDDLVRVIYSSLDKSTKLMFSVTSKRHYMLCCQPMKCKNGRTLAEQAVYHASKDNNVEILKYILLRVNTKKYGFYSRNVVPGFLRGNSMDIFLWYKKRGLSVSRYIVLDNIQYVHIDMLDAVGTIYDDVVLDHIFHYDRADIFKQKYLEYNAPRTINRIILYNAFECLKEIYRRGFNLVGLDNYAYAFKHGHERIVRTMLKIYLHYKMPMFDIKSLLIRNSNIQFPCSINMELNDADKIYIILNKNLNSVKHIVSVTENISSLINGVLLSFARNGYIIEENLIYLLSAVDNIEFRCGSHNKNPNVWIESILPKLVNPALSGFHPRFGFTHHKQSIIELLQKLVAIRPLTSEDLDSISEGYVFPEMCRFLVDHIHVSEPYQTKLLEHCTSKRLAIKIFHTQERVTKNRGAKRVKY